MQHSESNLLFVSSFSEAIQSAQPRADGDFCAPRDKYAIESVIAPVGTLMVTPHGAIVHADTHVLNLLNLRRSPPADATLKSLLKLDDMTDIVAALSRAQTGVTAFVECMALREGGSAFATQLQIQREGAEGSTLLRVLLTDLDPIKRLERSMRFVASASAVLNSSLDSAECVRRLLPQVADAIDSFCVLQLGTVGDLGEDSVFYALAPHVDENELRSAWSSYSHEESFLQCSEHVVWPRWVGESSPENEPLATFCARIGAKSCIVLPFESADGAHHVLFCGRSETVAPFNAFDYVLCDDVVRRIAAIINREEANARVASAIDMRDEVLAVTSHDIANPLAVVTLNAQLLELAPQIAEGPERLRREVAAIRRSAEKIDRMVRDLSDAVGLRCKNFALEVRLEEVGYLCRDAIGAHQQSSLKRNIFLDMAVEDSAALVKCDAARIAQVLGNLLGNAIKFTPPGGHISLTTARVDNAVRFTVNDTGPGLSARGCVNAFELYWRASEQKNKRGIGLGLYIVKQLIEAHGGRVGVRSKLGAGSQFWFELPLASRAPRSYVPRRAGPVRILLVDDDRDYAESIAYVLEACDFSVQIARDSSAAIDALRQGDRLPDCILLDWYLPGGGSAVLEYRAHDDVLKRIPLLVISSETSVLAIEGADASLRKPVQSERLVRAIRGVTACDLQHRVHHA